PIPIPIPTPIPIPIPPHWPPHCVRLALRGKSPARRTANSFGLSEPHEHRDRGHLFRIGANGADEVQTHLRIAEAWGYLAAGDSARSLALTDRVLAMLHRLA